MPGLAEMFAGTIHAFALELLKSEVPKYLRFEVLNEVQQSLFVDRQASQQSGLTACTDLQGTPLQRYKDTQRYLAALDILREADRDEKTLDGCTVLKGLESYSALLEARSYLDYSTILEAAVDVLTNDRALRERLAERIHCVIGRAFRRRLRVPETGNAGRPAPLALLDIAAPDADIRRAAP